MDALAIWQMQLRAVNLITNSSIPTAQRPAGMFQSYYLILIPFVLFAERSSVRSAGYIHREKRPSTVVFYSKQGRIYNVSQQPVTLHFQN
jgi:ABC-type uncharacterized transport system permease subunit